MVEHCLGFWIHYRYFSFICHMENKIPYLHRVYGCKSFVVFVWLQSLQPQKTKPQEPSWYFFWSIQGSYIQKASQIPWYIKRLSWEQQSFSKNNAAKISISKVECSPSLSTLADKYISPFYFICTTLLLFIQHYFVVSCIFYCINIVRGILGYEAQIKCRPITCNRSKPSSSLLGRLG